MFFKFFNKKTGKEVIKQFTTIEDIIQSTICSEEVTRYLESMRAVGHHGKAKAYITVIKNEGRKDEQILCKCIPNQLQDDGRDDMHNALWENQGAAAQLGFTHMAVTVDSGGLPSDATTTLAGEIASGGLERSDADTTTHTTGQNTTLVEHTYTASATHTLVQKGALFDANSTGTMGIIYLFTSATLVSGDTLKVSVTVTLDD